MGPQLGYYYPEIVQQIHLKGPDFESQGAAVPGLNMYMLIGRTHDYAWSLTSAGHDVRDVYAEELCEPDGSTPTVDSQHYLFDGECIPMEEFDAGLARLGGLGLVAGLAVAEALHACGLGQVRLKWPNDLVVPAPDGRLLKLGGLLVEGGGENAGPVRAVIGIGLNLRMPDQAASGIGQPWTDVHALAGDAAPGRNRLAGECVAALLPALDRFDRNGLAPFLERYALLDALRDRQVQIHGGDGVRTGTALGLAADGALRVHIEGAERLVHAGEVSVRPGAGAT